MSDTRVTIAETADVPATPSRFRPPTRTLFEGGMYKQQCTIGSIPRLTISVIVT